DLARDQDLVDDLREPERLGFHDLEERCIVLGGQLEIFAAQGADGTVDRSQRGAELVRRGGDEVAAGLLERTLVGDVSERVNRPLAEVDSGGRDPELTA